jgi:uncharacterized protein (TIGR03437 family)
MKPRWAAGLIFCLQLGGQEIRLQQVATGITAPTDIENAGDGSGRLFLVQQNGVIRILRNGLVQTQPFLNISNRTAANGEQGLLGLAFPPGFARSSRFYVDYTDLNGNTVIAMYRVGSNPDVADSANETALLHIAQPFANHNGGQLRFGPDGYLYIAMGDGGSGGDPYNNGQSLNSLLGKLLRVDVESSPGQVKIPPNNPFVNTAGARPEIWAYGLRNPWRFNFDSATNDLWIGDVGQDNFEEIVVQPASSKGGENYGWNIMEGAHCYRAGCSRVGLVLPVWEYSHSDGCSVIGGFRYRGTGSPGLRGTYLYGDLCSGTIWGLSPAAGGGWTNRRLISSGFSLTSFGQDEAGELYASNANNGGIYHIIGGQAPWIASGAVVNAASFGAGLTPGSLATVFAYGILDAPGSVVADRIPLPASLRDVSVTVNGISAPVYSLANANGLELLSFQTPFEIPSQGTASVVVSRGGQSSAAENVPIVAAQPGVYTSDGIQGVAVHVADYSLVTAGSPLRRSEYAYVFASGLGAVASAPKTGDAAPSTPPAATVASVHVTIGGVDCGVQYSGLAPGLVGVYQVNFQVTPGVPSGSVDLVVSTGGASSPPVKVIVE